MQVSVEIQVMVPGPRLAITEPSRLVRGGRGCRDFAGHRDHERIQTLH